jgi:hypothetical protein
VDAKCQKPDSADQSDAHEFVYSRRMEFVATPQLAQTEVYLKSRPADWPVLNTTGLTEPANTESDSAVLDHSVLHMPVHRTLAKLIKRSVQWRRNHVGDAAMDEPVAVIGAGCCALPSHLLSLPSLTRVQMHVVEPSTEVLDVAQRYFGARFHTDTTVPQEGTMHAYAMDGETFLSTHHDLRFAALVVDAFAERATEDAAILAAGELDKMIVAPPASLLAHLPDLHRALRPASDPVAAGGATAGGALLMNVYGPPDWITHVTHAVQQSGLFCTPKLVETQQYSELNHGVEAVRDAPGAENRNVVLVTMRADDQDYYDEIFSV